MSDAEAQYAFEALERRRIARLCECEDASSYTCSRCRRILRAVEVGEVVPKETDAGLWAKVNMASYKKGAALRAERARPITASVAPAFGCVGTTIRLRSGCYLDLLDPRPEHFTFADIAGSLSKLCRFGGQVDRFYSVAEHSFHCAHLSMLDGHSVDVQRAVFMHDAAEAFIGDIVKPLKLQLPQVATIERRIESVIAAKYGALGFAAYESIIREIDQAMLIHERRQLFTGDEVTWAGEHETRIVPNEICVTGWDAATAEGYFTMCAKWIGIEVGR